MNKWIIKKPKLNKDQNLPSTSNASYNNDLIISDSRDEPNYKRSGMNETNSGKDIVIQ